MKTSKARVLLCVVMTILMLAVAMSVSADTATVGAVTTAAGDGDVVVTVPVSGVTGKATIMVYPTDKTLADAKADPINNIKYIDEATATDGAAAFTFAVTSGQYNMTVGGGGATSVTTTLDATVNNAPSYASATASVAKNSGAYTGEVIGTYAATDADTASGDSLTYTIDAAATEAGFAIDTATGALTFTGTLADGNYTVTVTATDTKGATAACVVTVTVTTANTAPAFTAEAYTAEKEEGVYTNGIEIGTYTAEDGEGAVTYSVAEEGFEISANGVLTYTGTLDNGTYTATLTATDEGNLTDTATVTITVKNVAPVFDAGLTATKELEAGEYTNEVIGTYTATDAVDDVKYSVEAEGFAIDETTGALTFTGNLTEGDHTVVITATDGTDSATYTVTVTGVVSNTAPDFENDTETVTIAIGEYTSAKEVITVVATDAEKNDLEYSVDKVAAAKGFAVDANGNVTFTGEITEDIDVVVTVTDGSLSDSYTLSVTAEKKAFAAVSIAAIETTVKVPAEATDFTAAVGIPETVTVKYLYGEVAKEAEIAVDWALDAAALEGLEDGGTVNGTLKADALAEANIDLGEVENKVSFTYNMVETTFSVTVNGLEANVITAVPGSALDISPAYVGMGDVTYAYKMVELTDITAENTAPADEEFAAELETINAPAAGEGKRFIIYAKDSETGAVVKVVKYVYGNNPYQVAVTLDGQARYWNVKLGESVTAAVVVTDVNTAEAADEYSVSYALVKDGEEVATSTNGIITPEEKGVYSVVATVTINGVDYKGQRTLYVTDRPFVAGITVNGTGSALKIAENANLAVEADVDYVPAAGIMWHADIIGYNESAAEITPDWAALATREATTLSAGEEGTKKVVALFKRGDKDDAEVTVAKTVYVRAADKLYSVSAQTRDGEAYSAASIGDSTIELGISAIDGPKTIDELSAKIVIRDYKTYEEIYTYDLETATDTAEVKAADWSNVTGGAVRVEFAVYDGEAKVGSITRVLFL